jgi:hypothetical protein
MAIEPLGGDAVKSDPSGPRSASPALMATSAAVGTDTAAVCSGSALGEPGLVALLLVEGATLRCTKGVAPPELPATDGRPGSGCGRRSITGSKADPPGPNTLDTLEPSELLDPVPVASTERWSEAAGAAVSSTAILASGASAPRLVSGDG